jgi:diacylglycerol kinase (ATP)
MALGFVLGLERWEWCVLAGATGLVWVAECLNTALEALADLASPGEHPLAGRAKDIAAGAVLCASATAVIVGCLVFGPKLVARW